MLKDELTGNPRWGQNVIDKVNMKIFFPFWLFKGVLRFVLLCLLLW